MQRKRKWRIRRNDVNGYLFCAPLLLGIAVFSAYPMVSLLATSFRRVYGIGAKGEWVGFANYEYALTDSVFWSSLVNTMYIGLFGMTFGTITAFIVASLINHVKWRRLQNWFKVIYFFPNVISVVAIAILFSFLFHPSPDGVLNGVLGLFHLEPIGWFSDPAYSRISIVIMGVWWSLGYNCIIFLAGLQSVPKELYEAAEVDGASGLRKWWSITIPFLRPIFVFFLVMGVLSAMKRFTDVWLIGGTAGNPDRTLMTSVMYIYRNAFVSAQMGLAAAASYLLFVVILFLAILALALNRRKDHLY